MLLVSAKNNGIQNLMTEVNRPTMKNLKARNLGVEISTEIFDFHKFYYIIRNEVSFQLVETVKIHDGILEKHTCKQADRIC